MRLGYLNGRPIVAYSSIAEAISAKSCLTCRRYNSIIPCKYYSNCRAEKPAGQSPLFYSKASIDMIDLRLTIINGDIEWT